MCRYAVQRRAPRVVEALLLLKADPNAADAQGITPLMLAAYLGDKTGTRMVRDMLRHGARYVPSPLIFSICRSMLAHAPHW